ncbi:hypothetical protein [Photorhabdus sp. MH8.4]
MLSIKIGVLPVKRRSFMTLFTRTLESSAHIKRQFVKAQHLPVLAGSLSLCDYLRQMGERSAFIVAEVLDEQDWGPFERRYASTGRAPYSPRSMMNFVCIWRPLNQNRY